MYLLFALLQIVVDDCEADVLMMILLSRSAGGVSRKGSNNSLGLGTTNGQSLVSVYVSSQPLTLACGVFVAFCRWCVCFSVCVRVVCVCCAVCVCVCVCVCVWCVCVVCVCVCVCVCVLGVPP